MYVLQKQQRKKRKKRRKKMMVKMVMMGMMVMMVRMATKVIRARLVKTLKRNEERLEAGNQRREAQVSRKNQTHAQVKKSKYVINLLVLNKCTIPIQCSTK